MLRSLYIRNFALIEESDVTFGSGLNILTGETGAGKSILIGALGLLIGDRSSTDLIRTGSEKSVIEGTFTISDNESARLLLQAQDYDTGDDVVIRRELSTRGTSRSFINDSPAPLSLVRDLGDLLVDLHGQHDHQLLLRPQTHLHLLDDAGGLAKLVADFAESYRTAMEFESRLRDLKLREGQLRERHDFYQFQLQEFDIVDPKRGEEIAVEKELKILENSERLLELTSGIHGTLYAEENSVRDQLVRVRNLADQLAAIDASFLEHRNELAGAIATVEEVARSVQSYAAGFEVSFGKLESLRDRLLALSGLRKKYGGTLDAAIDYRDRIRGEIELAQNFERETTTLERELHEARRVAGDRAARLSKKRMEVARKISRSIERVLKTLGIENGRFTVELSQQRVETDTPGAVLRGDEWYAASSDGFDRAEFHISTNLGEEPKPLARIASGGEISRIMLSLKTILAKNDRLPLLVFDEIDTGISGRIASRVGAQMRDLASFHQIIAITHLPQIAAMSADHHVVEKRILNGRTITSVRRLSQDEHLLEVARLVSGEEVTESSLNMARELIAS